MDAFLPAVGRAFVALLSIGTADAPSCVCRSSPGGCRTSAARVELTEMTSFGSGGDGCFTCVSAPAEPLRRGRRRARNSDSRRRIA
jgi:hypothetical protein